MGCRDEKSCVSVDAARQLSIVLSRLRAISERMMHYSDNEHIKELVVELIYLTSNAVDIARKIK